MCCVALLLVWDVLRSITPGIDVLHNITPGIDVSRSITHTYLDTWSGFKAAKIAPWPSRWLHHFGKFLEPSDE